jgi:hypothetical protein
MPSQRNPTTGRWLPGPVPFDPVSYRRAYYLRNRAAILGQTREYQASAVGRAVWRRGHEKRLAAVAAIKLERGCADCGYRGHPAALQFDHLPGAVKLNAVATMRRRRWEVVLAEIAKCEVVCANCHAIRTAERGYKGRPSTMGQPPASCTEPASSQLTLFELPPESSGLNR